ncbi:MAG: oxygen-independent coproporphyrinogen III oxidase-like protein [Thauera phenolivorans]|uniref:Heme chaperone HemW n=1 Tax=Thauera phenolivorans TaxID=1792543 RepID=A0A7X7LX80_9RHOO|nr:radical SAM family heme chaperone HemW [Thauera phenolivorans]NLF54531.1 oxygen-independent coproporphyrinogen III oxidase-like protein [Thauera phenolivorans]
MSTRRIIPLTPAAGPARALPLPERARLDAPPPLSLYVHYPWCVRKCPYCDFNSHAPREGTAIPEAAWLDAVIADLQAALPQVWGRRVLSVFIGGGTPSLMSAPTLDRLLTAIRMLLPLDPLAEITLEANPGTVEAGRFRDYRAAGVNRLSLGIQSFDDAMLAKIGRIHGGVEARRAIEAATTHFERVNLDLMYALPGQTLAMALADVDTALGFGVQHLSCYHLTLEPNTPFAHDPPPLPDDDIAADMQEAIEARLAEAGFENYETSAFARPHEQSRHNLNYWTFGDYLGVGPGAHGKLSSHEGIVREMRHKHPARYLEAAARGDFVQERREVAVAELPFEFMMNALRLSAGFAPALFLARTGLPLEVIATELAEARTRGLLATADGLIRPTLQGRRFLNELLQTFLRD